MKRILLRAVLFGILVGVSVAVAGEAYTDNFEKTAWRVASSWSGQAEHRKDKKEAFGGNGYCELKATGNPGKAYGRCMQLIRNKDLWGKRYTYKLRAKGSGAFRIGVVLHVASDGKKDTPKTQWAEVRPLTDQYEEFRYELDAVSENVTQIALLAEVQGDNSVACFDSAVLEEAASSAVSLKADIPHLVIVTGSPRPALTFRLISTPAVPAGEEILIRLPDVAQLAPVKSGEGGIVIVPEGDRPQEQPDSLHIKAAHAASGAVAEAWVDVTKPERLAELDELAAKVRLAEPVKILILGDSLSDFDRGCNYIDKVGYFLGKSNPGKAETFNYGVAGDDCLRVLSRLEGAPGAAHKERYAGIFDHKYDLAFIFLGHNDTKAASAENYARPLVEPREQDACYRKIVARLRQEGVKRIVLLSPFSSDFDVCKANAEKQAGKPHNRFGEPQHLETFDATLAKLSTELELDRIDVYSPSRDHPQKAQLFRPNDGVHLSALGHELVAREILRYLAQRYVTQGK